MDTWTCTFMLIGPSHIGLLQTCVTIYGREMTCFTPETLRAEWVITFLCIAAGVICVTITIILLAVSYWKYSVMKFARWLGFAASKLLSVLFLQVLDQVLSAVYRPYTCI